MLYCYLHFYKHLNPLISIYEAAKRIDKFLKNNGIDFDWEISEAKTSNAFFFPVAMDLGKNPKPVLEKLMKYIFQELAIILLGEFVYVMNAKSQIHLSAFDLSCLRDDLGSTDIALEDGYLYHSNKIQMIEKGELMMSLKEAINYASFYPKYGDEKAMLLSKKLFRVVSANADEESIELMANAIIKCPWLHSDNDLKLEFYSKNSELNNNIIKN